MDGPSEIIMWGCALQLFHFLVVTGDSNMISFYLLNLQNIDPLEEGK